MLSIPLVDGHGKSTGDVEIDENILGGRVRPALLKQAVVHYLGNARQNTSATKSRGMVQGSTKKLYRQKGTGNARAGTRRQNIRRGGGVAFAKGVQSYKRDMNKKMRRLARNNAILAKIKANNVVVVDGFSLDAPSTKRVASLLRAVGAERSCVFALDRHDDTIHRSGRNIPKTDVKPIHDVNAYDVLRRKKFIMTRPAFDALVADPSGARATAETA